MISIAFYFILTGVYKVGVYLYNVLISLAVEGTDIFNINPVVENAYILVGTFMVFRIIITLLQMVIDPDKVSDKQVGAGKMLSRIVICFLLLISFNTIYNFMIDKIQPAVIGPDGFITNFVKVNYTTEPINPNDKKASRYENLQPGYVVVGSVFSSLLDLNTKFVSFTKSLVSSAVMPTPTKLVSLIANNVVDEKVCREAKDNEKGYKYDNYSELKKENSSLLYYPGLAGGAILYMGSVNFYVGYVCALGEMYDLNFVINLIIGLALVVFIFVMCIEIVVRDLKIIVLRVIAPIAFICYLNPKDKIFSQWLKSFASVYFDLFLKLFSISLATTIITASSDKLTQKHIGVILILGILTFAKILPSFISKIFGISGSGSFKESFNMAKKGFGLATAGVAAAAVGGVSKGYAVASNLDKDKKGRNWAIAKASLSGALTAGFSGAREGWKGKGASSAIKTARDKSSAYGDLTSTGGVPKFRDILKNRAASTFGIATAGEKAKAEVDASNTAKAAADDVKNTSEAEAIKSQTVQTELEGSSLGKTRATSRKFTVDELEKMKQEGVAKVNVMDANGKAKLVNIDDEINRLKQNIDTEIKSDSKVMEARVKLENAQRDKQALLDDKANKEKMISAFEVQLANDTKNGVTSTVNYNGQNMSVSDAISQIKSQIPTQANLLDASAIVGEARKEYDLAVNKATDNISKNQTVELGTMSFTANYNQLTSNIADARGRGLSTVDVNMTFGVDNNNKKVDSNVGLDISSAESTLALLKKQAGIDLISSGTNEIVNAKKKNVDNLIATDLSGLFNDSEALRFISEDFGIDIKDKDALTNSLKADPGLYGKLKDALGRFKDSKENSAEYITEQKMDEYRKNTGK